MKRILIRGTIVVFSAMALWRLGCVHAVVVGNDYETAIQVGARAKVVFRVVDDGGNPVRDARVDVGFWLPWNDRNGADGVTDSAGMFTVRGVSVGEMVWTVEKYGYYSSRATYHFFEAFPHKEDCVRFGRWQPYGAVREVVLRRKKNPIPMRVTSENEMMVLPGANNLFPFDVVECDWLPPYGNGKIEDVSIAHYFSTGESQSRLEIVFRFPHTGYYAVKKNSSEFQSPYYADSRFGYSTNLVLFQKYAPTIEQRYDTCDTCFILRLRTVLDCEGKIVSCIYGKIYGPIEFGPIDNRGGFFRYWQYLNMIPNDTNLEFDVKSNLRKYRDFPGPVRP